MGYQVLNVDRRLLVKSYMGEQNYFNLIRSEIGNQCSSNKIGVMWSNLQELVISRAVAFCTDWPKALNVLQDEIR